MHLSHKNVMLIYEEILYQDDITLHTLGNDEINIIRFMTGDSIDRNVRRVTRFRNAQVVVESIPFFSRYIYLSENGELGRFGGLLPLQSNFHCARFYQWLSDAGCLHFLKHGWQERITEAGLPEAALAVLLAERDKAIGNLRISLHEAEDASPLGGAHWIPAKLIWRGILKEEACKFLSEDEVKHNDAYDFSSLDLEKEPTHRILDNHYCLDTDAAEAVLKEAGIEFDSTSPVVDLAKEWIDETITLIWEKIENIRDIVANIEKRKIKHGVAAAMRRAEKGGQAGEDEDKAQAGPVEKAENAKEVEGKAPKTRGRKSRFTDKDRQIAGDLWSEYGGGKDGKYRRVGDFFGHELEVIKTRLPQNLRTEDAFKACLRSAKDKKRRG